ncbi:MAG TPA: rhodanese-like domain-containing protein [Candidatus Nitrosotalea sp.]|nr:rhodanese-like domain-containing protein [Candidatus Nitrosotalea sp.]
MSDPITAEQLFAMRRSGEWVLIDIRREADLEADGTMVPGAMRGNPESLDTWAQSLPAQQPVIVYCARGGSVSKSVTAELRARGVDANYVEGGIAAWKDFGGEVIRVKRP